MILYLLLSVAPQGFSTQNARDQADECARTAGQAVTKATPSKARTRAGMVRPGRHVRRDAVGETRDGRAMAKRAQHSIFLLQLGGRWDSSDEGRAAESAAVALLD